MAGRKMRRKIAERKLKKKKKKKTEKSKVEQQKPIVAFGNDDVVFEILVRLPGRSVGRLRCVSKSWLSMATSSAFVRAHTQHTRPAPQSLVIERPGGGERFFMASAVTHAGISLCKLRFPSDSSIIASCDGLLCLWSPVFWRHHILNPLTGRSIILPANTRLQTRFLGLYFHQSTSEYRLLAGKQEETSMLVVGEFSWKHIACRLPAFCDLPYATDLNGCLHWLAWKQKPASTLYGLYPTPPDIIMIFDKETEVYGLLSMPPLSKLLGRGGNLMSFNGKLGLWEADNYGIDVWIMEDRWVKKYSLNYVNVRAGAILTAF